MEIPHIIHYCWFGPRKPREVRNFISSWKKLMPDYTFLEWNEQNADFSRNAYAREAYEAKRYAFVSDVVRVEKLYQYGGVYFDTDIKVLKRFDEYLKAGGAVFSMERVGCISTAFMAAEPGHPVFGELLEEYGKRRFKRPDGREDRTTINERLTRILSARGLSLAGDGIYTLSSGIRVYPAEYFSAFDTDYWYPALTDKTCTIHYMFSSWHKPWVRIKGRFYHRLFDLLGESSYRKVRTRLKLSRNRSRIDSGDPVPWTEAMLLGHAVFDGEMRLPENADWRAVYEEMKSQTVAALVLRDLPKLPVDAALRSEWEDEAMAQAARGVMKRYEQDAVVRTLEDAGIPFAILKGTAAAMYYPEPELRLLGDIDVLVREADFKKAGAALKEAGFRDAFPEMNTSRHINFERNDVQVELHRRFSFVNGKAEAGKIDRLLARGLKMTRQASVEDSAFPVLPEVLNGLVLLLHIGQHLESGLGLRQIMDWLLFVDRKVDDSFWERKMKPLTDAVGMTPLALTVTRMGQIFLGLPEKRHSFALAADRETAEELFALVLMSGNFGKKDPERSRAVRIMSASLSPRGFFENLQGSGVKNWPAVRKYPALRPFAFLYQFFRYLSQVRERGNIPETFLSDYGETRRRARLLKRLHATRQSAGIAEPRNGDAI
ncbi:MAG: nucleotidyltransferase family protein [Lachnospiraceae bacterium]|nr:nucleotidyltransferase family protein [Lachnospiraceae bacterium]